MRESFRLPHTTSSITIQTPKTDGFEVIRTNGRTGMRSTGAVNRYVRNKAKGEPFDVYVGRGSPFGNPFHIGKDGSRAEVVRKFEEMLTSNEELMKLVRSQLKSKTLGCFCAPQLCHAHVLAWYANGLDGDPS